MIWVFGDSFAADGQLESWVNHIGPTKNFASNGSSEYRILKNYLLQKPNIKETDTILFVHTSQSRIFLKDDKQLSSRTLLSHPNCDIIVHDIFEKKEKYYINILESIWDEDFFNDVFNLIADKLVGVPNSHHVTFFESSRNDLLNLNYIWKNNPGDINHLNNEGNMLVAEIVNQMLKR
jgi:hypothetical protein